MTELYGLQAHGIAVRLVQLVPQLNLAGMPVPSGPGVGPQVTVLGVPYVPSWAGINGPRGFNSGHFDPRVYEEGTWQLTFPNAEGEDGLLHRRRLLIVQTGKVTPLGGNVVSYQGGAFRPGDEYLEIYRTSASGAPGKLLMTGAVTKATLTSGSITLEGADALWLLKKQRERASGFFFNAPRDVCEHYTRVWQAVAVDDFPQDGRFNTGVPPATTADGLWKYDYVFNVPPATNAASTWTPSAGTAIRLATGAKTQYACLASAAGIPACAAQQPDVSARWEVRFRFANFDPTATVVVGFGAGSTTGYAVPSKLGPRMTIYAAAQGNNPAGYVVLANTTQGGVSGKTSGSTFAIPNWNATTWHTAAVELRDRYALFFVDGQLVGVMPQLGMVDPLAQTASTAVAFVYVTGAAVAAPFAVVNVDLDYAVLRATVPGYLRPASPANLGDYFIPGAPVPGSCSLEVWQRNDQPVVGSEFSLARLSQFSGKFTSPTLAFGYAQDNGTPSWWPQNAGSWSGPNWAARASGALYLTLGNYDYQFRTWCDDGARLWVGKTRLGEQLIDNWPTLTQTGHGMTLMTSPKLTTSPVGGVQLTAAASAGATAVAVSALGMFPGELIRIGTAPPYEYAYVASISGSTLNLRDALVSAHASGSQVAVMNQGSLAGMPTGWYPFVHEFVNYAGGPGAAPLFYARSDQPGYWNLVGASAYIHTVAAMFAKYGTNSGYYWPLNEGLGYVSGPAFSEVQHGWTAAITAGSGAGVSNTQSCYAPGDQAVTLNGGIASARTGDYLTASASATVSTSGWTISAMFNSAAVSGTSGSQEILRKDGEIALRVNNDHVEAFGWSAGGAGAVAQSAAASISANTWYHVVATWDGSTIWLYLNGVQVGSANWSGQVTTANPVRIGAFGSGTAAPTAEWFNGSINHLFVLPAAMSVTDVATLFVAASSAPHVPFADSGVVDSTQQPYRYVSHYDQLLQTIKDWGLQITTEPMQLESGEFPGRLRPLVRVGRDTEYVVGSPQVRTPTASDIQDAITAEEVADVLVADAQGLADPSGASQIAAEVFNFSQLMGIPTGSAAVMLHPWISEEYDQSNDVSFPDLLVQRLSSLLALRGSPWEQVAMAHRPTRQLLDTFPLTGTVAEFNWSPGDGVRLDLPELGIRDQSPRQILGVTWPITPAGLGAPAISLRQRPRNFRQLLRDITRDQRTASRTYQRQFVVVTGSIGQINSAGAGTDSYTRVPLPASAANIVSATFQMNKKADSSFWTIEVNGLSTGLQVSAAGNWDVTSAVTRFVSANAAQPSAYARLTGGSSAAQHEYCLQLLVKV